MSRLAIALFAVCLPFGFVLGMSGDNSDRGQASYYASHYEGRPTASGEIFRQSKLTAASWKWFGHDVRVTNRRTGESVVVRVNDRGPAKRLVREGRIIDLSPAAFRIISPEGLRPGLIDVKVEPVSRWR